MKYDKRACKQAKKVMASGGSKASVAGHLGISSRTLYRWIKTHPEFKEAIEVGESLGSMYYEKMLIQCATTDTYKGNYNALRFLAQTVHHKTFMEPTRRLNVTPVADTTPSISIDFGDKKQIEDKS